MRTSGKINRIFLVLTGMIFIMGIVGSAEFTPQGDINLRNVYQIINATNISASYYCNATTCYTIQDFIIGSNSGNLSWNESYADLLYSAIGTGGNVSWNESLANTLYSGIEWDYNQSLATFNMWNSTWATDNTGTGNVSWNQSFAGTLYSAIKWGYNHTTLSNDYADAQDVIFNTSIKNYVDGQDVVFNTSMKNYVDGQVAGLGDNSSWNQSFADNLYAEIKWGYNQSLNTFTMWNSTWDNKGWVLDQGYSTTGDNSSWNESFADTLYSEIKWNYNQTTATYNIYNDAWLSTYNATYDALTPGNLSWNESLADETYEPISIQFDATTINITCMNSPSCTWYLNATDSCTYWPSGGKDCGAA